MADARQLTGATVPSGACAADDACQVMGADPLVLTCSGSACTGSAEIRLPATLDLTSDQGLPAEVVQYGVSTVTLKKIDYWLKSDSLNVEVPKIDVYVAASAARDEHDATAVLLGSTAKLPVRATACADTLDAVGDAAAGQSAVCILPTSATGKKALETFAADYKQKFQLIVHAALGPFKAGDAIPTGAVDFLVEPVVSFSVLR